MIGFIDTFFTIQSIIIAQNQWLSKTSSIYYYLSYAASFQSLSPPGGEPSHDRTVFLAFTALRIPATLRLVSCIFSWLPKVSMGYFLLTD
jgi:hypothetical protein